MLQRGQTATEYIVITAVVIVVALVGATILGIFPGVGADVGSDVTRQEFLSGAVAVENYATNEDGTIMVLRNNNPRAIDIDDLSLEGNNCTSSPALPETLKPGQTLTVTCTNLNDSVITTTEPSISILYEDSGTNQQFVVTYGDSAPNFAGGPAVYSYIDTVQDNVYWVGAQNGCWNSTANPHPICTCVDLERIDDNATVRAWDYDQQNHINFVRCDNIFGTTYSTGVGWEPLGTLGADAYTGTYDGRNKTIQQLFINNLGADGGLFEYVDNAAFLNLGIVDVNMTSGSTGILSNDMIDSSADNVYTTGSIITSSGAAGFATYGYNADIRNSYSSAFVKGTATVGGILGYFTGGYAGEITDVVFNGSVTGTNDVGGILGNDDGGGLTSNTYVSGTVNGSSNVGGLVGYANNGLVDEVFSTATVTCTGSDCAGIIGRSEFGFDSFTNAYWLNLTTDDAETCVANQATGAACTVLNTSANITYFYNISNDPMDTWSFVNDWNDSNDLVSFPTLQGMPFFIP